MLLDISDVNHETSNCCIDSIKCYDARLVEASSESKIQLIGTSETQLPKFMLNK